MVLMVPPAVFGPAWLRRAILFFGGIIFYAFWRIDFTALVLFTAFVDWFGGLRIYHAQSQGAKKAWVTLSLVMNLVVLGFFKYFYFAVGAADGLVELLGQWTDHPSWHFTVDLPFKIILPLGISFYTFHSLSYVFDMYRGLVPPIKRYTQFITYVMFWTQLVAGPILRAHEIIPQLDNYRRPTKGEVSYALEEILQGFFKKIVLADSIAQIVDPGFAVPAERLGMLDVWVLAFAFGFQIYFDFSGYSSIALGSARLMGFQFPPNFNWPYLATSPREFWKRWHISLSTWIRDYLYLPLQGAKFRGRTKDGLADAKAEQEVTEARRTIALFLTWFIMGFWHGANWTFAFWGLWHAALVWLHRATEAIRVRFPMWFRVAGGFAFTLPMEMLGWIFFRAPSLQVAFTMIGRAFDVRTIHTRTLREIDYVITFLYLLGFLGTAAAWRLNKSPAMPRLVRLGVLTVSHAVMFFGVFLLLRQVKSFIYFQF
jgi:D-alanyl-lipoteichoic acid acyltransferase DltB (MBOAT superfamily)